MIVQTAAAALREATGGESAGWIFGTISSLVALWTRAAVSQLKAELIEKLPSRAEFSSLEKRVGLLESHRR